MLALQFLFLISSHRFLIPTILFLHLFVYFSIRKLHLDHISEFVVCGEYQPHSQISKLRVELLLGPHQYNKMLNHNYNIRSN